MTPNELKEARLSLGLSQHQMGLMLGYADTRHTRQQINRMERGTKPIRNRHVQVIRAYLSGYRPANWPKQQEAPYGCDDRN